jgi:hypothetical protein
MVQRDVARRDVENRGVIVGDRVSGEALIEQDFVIPAKAGI